MSCPQPTPQYGQIDGVTCAASCLGRRLCVRSDMASDPVPSTPVLICWMSGQRESRSLSTACLHEVPQKRKAETDSQMILAGQAVAIARVDDKSERHKKNAFFCLRLTDLILRSITTSFNLTAPIPDRTEAISCAVC